MATHGGINYFRPYLYGKKFLVKSDDRPLEYLFEMKNPSPKLTRMRWDHEEYDFQIDYSKSRVNVKQRSNPKTKLTPRVNTEIVMKVPLQRKYKQRIVSN